MISYMHIVRRGKPRHKRQCVPSTRGRLHLPHAPEDGDMGGMELLARLRAQRGGPAPPPPGGGGNGAAAAADTRDASVNGMLNATPTPSTVSAAFNVERTVSVDVCGGVDCAGAGFERRGDGIELEEVG